MKLRSEREYCSRFSTSSRDSAKKLSKNSSEIRRRKDTHSTQQKQKKQKKLKTAWLEQALELAADTEIVEFVPYEDLLEIEEAKNELKYNRAIIEKKRRMTDHIKTVENLSLEGNLSENWRRFKRYYDIFAIAIGIDEKADVVKINTFLNAVGSEAVEIFDAFNLTEVQKASYVEVIKAFEEFCKVKKNPVYERFVFHQRHQKDGESFDLFLMDLKKLIKNCEYGADKVDEMLRDQIVTGVYDKRLQTKLLEIADLSYATAVDKAKASEIARDQVATMNKNAIAVNEVKRNNENKNYTQYRSKNQSNERNSGNSRNSSNNNRQSRPHGQNAHGDKKSNNNNSAGRTNTNGGDRFNCRRCGNTHRARECPAYGKTCTKCSKANHFSRVCRARDITTIELNKQNNNNDDDNNNEFYIGCIEREVNVAGTDDANRNGTVWIERVRVNGRDVAFKVDTGAEIDVLPASLCERIGVRNFDSTTITLRAFGGERVPTRGTCSLNCVFNNESLLVKFAVVDIDTMPILGLQTCRRFKIVSHNNEHNL